MHDRANPLEHPDRHPFVLIKLGEPHGDHAMRVPSVLALTKLVKHLERAHMAIMLALSGDANRVSMATIIKESGPEMAASCGALIGLGWYHRDRALDADRATFDRDPIRYGEAVFEELHGEGYTLDDVLKLGMTLFGAIWDQSQLSAEVAERAAFFFPTRVPTNSSPSTSESTSSATPSGSPN